MSGDRRIVRVESDGSLTVLADRYRGRRLNSPNDLARASDGSLFFTDPPFGLPLAFSDPDREPGFSGVYRLARDGELELLTDRIRAPNGIALSPDERWPYVSNPDREDPVYLMFPLAEDGTLGESRVLYDASAWVGRYEGAPDGLEVDRQGNDWAAGPGGVHIVSPGGERLGSVILGGATSNVAWGGPHGADLYITAGDAVWRLRTRTTSAGRDRAGGGT